MLCAEVAGPGSPYNAVAPPHVEGDVGLFAFDLLRHGETGFVAKEARDEIVAAHALPAVETFGRYRAEDTDAIREVLARIDDGGGEGVVIEDASNPQHRAKYVGARASINDMRVNAHNLIDLPPEYFTDRILRAALYLVDRGERPDDALRRELGGALLDGLMGAVEQAGAERHVAAPYHCRFRDRGNAEAFMRHLERAQGSEVQVLRDGIERDGEYWVLRFRRVSPRITGLLGHLLRGGLVYDP